MFVMPLYDFRNIGQTLAHSASFRVLPNWPLKMSDVSVNAHCSSSSQRLRADANTPGKGSSLTYYQSFMC